MFANIFGGFLVKNGVITDAQLLKIKEEQAKTRVKLGLIAVAEKLMTSEQADEVNRKQAQMDKRFGDIAVELGYLTDEQVGKLLKLQGNPYMQFMQSITDLGYADLAACEAQVVKFQEAEGMSFEELEVFKSGDVDGISAFYLAALSPEAKALGQVAIRTLNRLISTDLSMAKAYETATAAIDNGLASQNVEGDLPIATGICGSKDGMLVIANTYAGEEFEQVDLDALDSIGEFINIVNGLYATALSNQDIQVELLPPNYTEGACSLAAGAKGTLSVIPMVVCGSPVMLVLCIKDAFVIK